MRTICLTGGTGFVGSHLLELLEQEPEVKVKVLSRKQADMPYHADHVQVFLGDLLDSNSLVRFLEPDSITINLAYMSNRLPEDNIEAGLNLARACAKVGVAHLIHVSSAVVVGRTAETVITEKTTNAYPANVTALNFGPAGFNKKFRTGFKTRKSKIE